MSKRKFEEALCSHCNDLDARNHGKTTTDLQGRSILSLQIQMTNLDRTCQYCDLLRKIILDFVPILESVLGKPSIHLDLTEGAPASVEVTGTELREEGAGVPVGELATGVLFYLCAINENETDQSSLPVCSGLYSLRSDTEECYRFAGDNLTECLQNHENCKRATLTTKLPKRIIDVDKLYLVETDEEEGRYACLSHCWGKVNVVKTKTDNLAEMTEGIPWESLSNVFRDAVSVCRYLKTKYLWIDSLCIIQDSKKDWEIESAKMCDYYENADFTISAASSPNGEVSFLASREEKWLPVHHKVNLPDGSVRTFYARAHGGSSITQPIENSGPLSYRGWVWQEAVLSKRILHYTPSELIWECTSEIKTEDGAIPRGLFSMRLTQQLARCESQPEIGWHDLVGTYSIRELTYETDRLPALSGVAKKMNALIKSDYLAGLWRTSLLPDLCWSVDYGSNPDKMVAPCSEEYLAPSWAWPSVDGPIVFEDVDAEDETESLAVILEAKCTVPGLNPYGEVSDGYLVLRGRIADVQINCEDPEDCWTYTIGDADDREPMTADCILAVDRGTVKRATQLDDHLDSYSCLAPCVLIRKTAAGDGSCFFFLLVLQKLKDGEYCRIGCASLDDDELFQQAVEQTIRIV